jgi:hypothetical protein
MSPLPTGDGAESINVEVPVEHLASGIAPTFGDTDAGEGPSVPCVQFGQETI